MSSPDRVHYNLDELVIPERSTSLSPSSQQERLRTLQSNYRDLKRKASTMSQRSQADQSEEYLLNRQEMIRNVRNQYETSMHALKKAYTKGDVDPPTFIQEMQTGWKKRAKLMAEEVVIERKRSFVAQEISLQLCRDRYSEFPDAYAALFTNLFKSVEATAGWEKRNKHKHEIWRDGLIEYYNVAEPAFDDMLWCPILQQYNNPESSVAAHIVPHSLGYQNAGYMFGDTDEGFSMIWSLRNGIIMTKQLEKAFDCGAFIIVPIATAEDQPQRYKVVLMDERRRNEQVIAQPVPGKPSFRVKWNDLDNRELAFKNDKRPARRFLYYHYVTTILRYMRFEKEGWAEKRLTVPNGIL